MNTWKISTQRLDEEMDNAGVPLGDNELPPIEEVAHDDQDPANPPPMKDGDIRVPIL